MSPRSAAPAFLKGHGTENDFILLPDGDDTVNLTDNRVRALCDRHGGLGADGVIRVAPAGSGGYFMDYRNADGSRAEMCGNGARVFARFLVDAGWAQPGRIPFATRGGTRVAHVPISGDVSIEMGPVTLGGPSWTVLDHQEFKGIAVDVGNPHLVCLHVPDEAGLAALDLTRAPGFDPVVFPNGVNIEFVTTLGPDAVRMRVHERGVGQTRSCGTGTVAVAAAFLADGGRPDGRVDVHVPGGRVVVDIAPGASMLTGPAVIVASGSVDPAFWSAHR